MKESEVDIRLNNVKDISTHEQDEKKSLTKYWDCVKSKLLSSKDLEVTLITLGWSTSTGPIPKEECKIKLILVYKRGNK